MVNDNIQKRTLSIRISTNGFCFCSYLPAEPDSLQYHFYKTDSSISLVANLRNAVEECPLISAGTEYSIKAIIETAEFTTLPTEFDRREDYKLFYRYCFPKADSSIEIVANKLNAQELTLIFPVDKAVALYLALHNSFRSFAAPEYISVGEKVICIVACCVDFYIVSNYCKLFFPPNVHFIVLFVEVFEGSCCVM